MKRNSQGFSLIELLIVVAIILIIAAIAIPNLLRARMAANESSAVASVRTITTGEVTYQTAYPTVGYAPALVNLGGALAVACVPSSTTGCIIDSVLANNGNPANGGKSGYQFTTGAGTIGTPTLAPKNTRGPANSELPASTKVAISFVFIFVASWPDGSNPCANR